MSEKGPITFHVKGQDPLEAVPALFSNFVAISRVGTDVQFEFLFLDLNQIALILEKAKGSDPGTQPALVGKTVAKVVMPAAAFIQIREHIDKLFEIVQELVKKVPEVQNEHGRTSSG